MANYGELFRLVFHHRYFTDNRCRGLSFSALGVTDRMMDNSGLLLRTSTWGCSVLYDREKIELLTLLADDAELNFHLKVSINDHQFGYYSVEKICQNNQRLSVTYVEPDQTLAPQNQLSPVYLDPSALAELVAPDSPNVSLNNQFLAAFAFSAANLAQMLKADTPTLFTVQFEPLKTLWQYYFCGDWLMGLLNSDNALMAQDEGPIGVVDINREVDFSELKLVILPSGDTALSAQSATELPLQQVSQYHFQLCQGNTKLLEHLPVANIHQQNRQGTQLLSEIYVNQSKRIH